VVDLIAFLQRLEILAGAEASVWCRRNLSKAGEGEAILEWNNGGISRHGAGPYVSS
jgi:hypothetical protein